jgi:hypothetical protein
LNGSNRFLKGVCVICLTVTDGTKVTYVDNEGHDISLKAKEKVKKGSWKL